MKKGLLLLFIGAILSAVSGFGTFGSVCAVAGFVLLIVALVNLKSYDEHYQIALRQIIAALIIAVIGIIVAAIGGGLTGAGIALNEETEGTGAVLIVIGTILIVVGAVVALVSTLIEILSNINIIKGTQNKISETKALGDITITVIVIALLAGAALALLGTVLGALSVEHIGWISTIGGVATLAGTVLMIVYLILSYSHARD